MSGEGPLRSDDSFLPAQMTDEWINDVLMRMQLQGGELEKLADKIFENKSKITKIVTALDRRVGSDGTLNFIKIEDDYIELRRKVA